MYDHTKDLLIKPNFENQLSKAFAYHIWPLLNSGSRIGSFSQSDPIILLAHNLDYWLPYAYQVIERHLRSFGRIPCENPSQKDKLSELRSRIPDTLNAERPLHGGSIWRGEVEAWEATKQIVEAADHNGKLRAIIEAVRSNRIEDDFSSRWSYAREDFERKLYHKRTKIKVSFVELDDTIPVHGPCSELDEDLLWEDFTALLNKKERHVIVCLRSGITHLGEISKILGYANHSPVSKALAKIRIKAKKYLLN
jgi:hypothetical protein